MRYTKKRNLFLDLAKAFAIILVVFGHCIQFGSGENYLKESLFFENICFKYIYSFHMPLFMLISGYLFAFGINKPTKEILANKFKSLIIPILTWALISLASFVVTRLFTGEFNINYTLGYFILYSIHSLWFLWAVFYNILIVTVVNKLFKDSIIIYVLIFFVSFIIPDSYNLALYKFMYPFFVMGYLYKKHNLQERLQNIHNNYFIFTTGVLFFILLTFFERDSYIYTSKHTIIGKDIAQQLYIDFFRYIIGLIGSVFTISLLYKIYKSRILNKILNKNNFIITIGKSTMGIYIISEFININPLSFITKDMSGPDYLVITVESISIIIICILIMKIIQKHRILNKYLLGAKG